MFKEDVVYAGSAMATRSGLMANERRLQRASREAPNILKRASEQLVFLYKNAQQHILYVFSNCEAQARR